jgi:hypothetical protein
MGVINRQVYTAQSSQNVQLITSDGFGIDLYLKSSHNYNINNLYSLVITPYNTTLVGNTSYLSAQFNDGSGLSHVVCVGYYTKSGLNQILQNENCINGSAGIINYGGGYVLNRNYDWVANIFVQNDDGTTTLFNSYTYPGLQQSIFSSFQIYLKGIILMILLSLLALAIYLKNMQLFAVGEMILSLSTPWVYPGLIGWINMSLLIILGITIFIFNSKKEEVSF